LAQPVWCSPGWSACINEGNDGPSPKTVPRLQTSKDKKRSLVRFGKNREWSGFHIGDFATEAEAKNWILTKSKYWPGGAPK
jgi:hypothetical protein